MPARQPIEAAPAVVQQILGPAADGANEYRYPEDPDLRSAGTRTEWWFRDERVPFEEWLRSVEQDPIWQITRTKPARQFAVYLDQV